MHKATENRFLKMEYVEAAMLFISFYFIKWTWSHTPKTNNSSLKIQSNLQNITLSN